eukprot:360600-Chlamydomonas_euryale.AAC.1
MSRGRPHRHTPETHADIHPPPHTLSHNTSPMATHPTMPLPDLGTRLRIQPVERADLVQQRLRDLCACCARKVHPAPRRRLVQPRQAGLPPLAARCLRIACACAELRAEVAAQQRSAGGVLAARRAARDARLCVDRSCAVLRRRARPRVRQLLLRTRGTGCTARTHAHTHGRGCVTSGVSFVKSNDGQQVAGGRTGARWTRASRRMRTRTRRRMPRTRRRMPRTRRRMPRNRGRMHRNRRRMHRTRRRNVPRNRRRMPTPTPCARAGLDASDSSSTWRPTDQSLVWGAALSRPYLWYGPYLAAALRLCDAPGARCSFSSCAYP